jgi:hypothetical protein
MDGVKEAARKSQVARDLRVRRRVERLITTHHIMKRLILSIANSVVLGLSGQKRSQAPGCETDTCGARLEPMCFLRFLLMRAVPSYTDCTRE